MRLSLKRPGQENLSTCENPGEDERIRERKNFWYLTYLRFVPQSGDKSPREGDINYTVPQAGGGH